MTDVLNPRLALQCTPVLLCLAYLLARDFAHFMVKRGLSRVEDLVLDLEVAEAEKNKKE